VVVKVQHRGIDAIFKRDLKAARVLASIIAKLDPEGVPDLRPIIFKLREVTLNELDFRLEAANTIRAARAVQELGVDVVIPTVIPELVGQRAMGMSYVDGVAFKDFDKLPEANPERLVAALVDHYAVQFTADGLFNADPHPGNLMIERGTGRLVVLDWGMCITLPEQVSMAYAKLFFAVSTGDLWALVEAFEAAGMAFKEGDVFEPYFFMSIMRFVLRDSKPITMAKQELASANEIGDKMYYEGPKRYSKAPVTVFSGEFMYFGKALELLYMVSCKLGVSHPILRTFFRRAYARVLGRQHGLALPKSPHDFLPALPDVPAVARNALEQDLLKLFSDFYRQGYLLGAQLCLENVGNGTSGSTAPHMLAEIAIGVKGWADLQPISKTTLFNLMDISKVLVSLVVLKLVDDGKIQLDDVLGKSWDAFSKEKKHITVEHVLAHTAGCWQPIPPSIKTLEEVMDFEKMLAAFGEAPGVEAPGKIQRYHHSSFGFLCAGICRHLAKCELSESWESLVKPIRTQSNGSIAHNDLILKTSSEVQDLAGVHKSVSSANGDEMTALIGRIGGLMGTADSSDPIAKACSETFGREHLFDLSVFLRAQGVPGAHLPGLQAFGTARGVAAMMESVAAGRVLSDRMLQEMVQSRRQVDEIAPTSSMEGFQWI
jgi:tRNA A-37 threonylcarbamoyl transferase component Bud32